MSCCGKRRAETRRTYVPARDGAESGPRTVTGGTMVGIRYLHGTPIMAVGPVSGQRYYFSGREPLQPVDARDAPGFLQTGIFRVAP